MADKIKAHDGADRILVPSARVPHDDQAPEMSALEITRRLNQAIQRNHHDVIICNFANADMVGHSGNFPATARAVETLDYCLGPIYAQAQKTDTELLITADHGNAEPLRDNDTTNTQAEHHTAHTCNPVPLLYVGRGARPVVKQGILSDIAPTMLHILGLPVPNEMTGRPLLSLTTQTHREEKR